MASGFFTSIFGGFASVVSAMVIFTPFAQAQPSLDPNLVDIGDTAQGNVSLDLRSFKWDSPNGVTGWLLFTPSSINEARKVGASFIRAKAHIDCAAKRYHISTWVAFKANGETIGRGEAPLPIIPLPPPQPNPLRDRLIAFACAKE